MNRLSQLLDKHGCTGGKVEAWNPSVEAMSLAGRIRNRDTVKAYMAKHVGVRLHAQHHNGQVEPQKGKMKTE
jgi:hypothetical protein